LSNNIRLVVIDIDGCLTPGEAQPWDFSVLQFVAELNRKARADARRFAVTLCTGRQEPYVEAMMQAIDAHAPGIYENGGGLYSPAQYRFAENPAIDAGKREKIAKVREILAKEIVETGMGQFQPGKEVSHGCRARLAFRSRRWQASAIPPAICRICAASVLLPRPQMQQTT
jgi:hypothetical protein